VVGVTDQRLSPPAEAESSERPEDVDTGFWLWIVALPLMVAGYVVDLVSAPELGPKGLVYAVSGVFLVVIASIVLTFLLLMRQGYRWARTLLTGGGAATVMYAVTNMFNVQRPAMAAVGYAVATIIGSVCIAGGAYLLHRKDAHGFFVR
jgi:hypothetical protein